VGRLLSSGSFFVKITEEAKILIAAESVAMNGLCSKSYVKRACLKNNWHLHFLKDIYKYKYIYCCYMFTSLGCDDDIYIEVHIDLKLNTLGLRPVINEFALG
jgi:hypothetical protein